MGIQHKNQLRQQQLSNCNILRKVLSAETLPARRSSAAGTETKESNSCLSSGSKDNRLFLQENTECEALKLCMM